MPAGQRIVRAFVLFATALVVIMWAVAFYIS